MNLFKMNNKEMVHIEMMESVDLQDCKIMKIVRIDMVFMKM